MEPSDLALEILRDIAGKLYDMDAKKREAFAVMLDDMSSVLRTHHALHGALSTDETGYLYRELIDMYKMV